MSKWHTSKFNIRYSIFDILYSTMDRLFPPDSYRDRTETLSPPRPGPTKPREVGLMVLG
jgi:hypothetical protein